MSTKPRYDVEMIQDFLEHLKWSLRRRKFEHEFLARHEGEFFLQEDEEVTAAQEVVAKYRRERGCVLLAGDDVSVGVLANADDAKMRAWQLRYMEELGGLLAEALSNAEIEV